MSSFDNRCDIKTHGECGCQQGFCHQRQEPTAPVFVPTKRDALAVIAFGLIVGSIAFVSLSAADRQFHRQQLEQQEQIAWPR